VQSLPTPAIAVAPVTGAVCWGAILAGSAAAAAISLLLFALVIGVDLATLPAQAARAIPLASTAGVATRRDRLGGNQRSIQRRRRVLQAFGV